MDQGEQAIIAITYFVLGVCAGMLLMGLRGHLGPFSF